MSDNSYNKEFSKLQKEIQFFIENGAHPKVLNNLLMQLYKFKDSEALPEVIKLASSDYGGFTYKGELQIVATTASIFWGAKGIEALENMTIDMGGLRPISNTINLLMHISSKSLSDMNLMTHLECIQKLNLKSSKYQNEELVNRAKEALVNVVKCVEKQDTFYDGLLINFGFANNNAQRHLFAALMARWFNLSSYGVEEFRKLINTRPINEIECQLFLISNQYILEPFHAQIWSKPRFGEKLVPDFLIQSMDNSYTVVEIERPDFNIMTKGGELSAKTTHAKRQTLDFRNWVINNQLYAINTYPKIYSPFCLVVIGMESDLDEMQKERLRQENESTKGVLKIVGFDWLYERAKSTFDNIIKFGFDSNNFRKPVN